MSNAAYKKLYKIVFFDANQKQCAQTLCLCAALLILLTTLGIGQEPARFAVPTNTPNEQSAALPQQAQDDFDQIIRDGQVLEAEARWTEVLAHYEAALRNFRNDNTLMERYRIARFHCDVGRRFHDVSYINLLRSMSVVETLNFFEEVVTHIQDRYVDMPLWESMFRHGIQSFSIALADPSFRTAVNLNITSERVNSYLAAVQTTVNGWKIRDREDMKNGILHIADAAQKQLGLNPSVVLMEFTCGVISSLDPNTGYLTPNQYNDESSVIYGNLVGIGVELRSDRTSLLIVRVVPGSPAESSGLKGGDRIVAVDGTSTRGRDTENAANLLQGAEGSVVRLTVLPSEMGQPQREISVTRRQIDVPSVEDVRMLNEQLGYIKLTRFHSKTRLELTRALTNLDRQGMKCLVLDMRQNPGGLFHIGVEVASMFIEQGAIVRTQGRDRTLDSPCMARGETWRVPLIVLIDEESASAAEIVAGAIRDHNRGTIIGRRSYGKGTIQQIIPVQTGASWSVRSGIKLTTEKFYSPLGWPYSGVGVTPHVTVSDEARRTASARPLEGPLGGILPLPILRSATSNLDDPFIQEAVRASLELL
ncbi:MAG: S41 family peptidase [Planctomycetaceae bacterium]|nr:S41 family peptidase [Planctomycetaceae bacterium]